MGMNKISIGDMIAEKQQPCGADGRLAGLSRATRGCSGRDVPDRPGHGGAGGLEGLSMDQEAILSAKLLRVEEVARLLKIGRSTVYVLCRRGQLPYVAINHSIRIPAQALARWIQQHTKPISEDEP